MELKWFLRIGLPLLVFMLPSQSSLDIPAHHNVSNVFAGILKSVEKHFMNLTHIQSVARTDIKEMGSNFSCPPSTSPTIPTSVHLLRPGDIKVVAAMGDSLTAAYAAKATTFQPVYLEYPGVSASIGGDSTLEEVITLPNIFKKYNRDIYGFSTGQARIFTQPSNKKFNVAVTGSFAREVPQQARELITMLKDDSSVNLKKDWKFITIFIGTNDLCRGCTLPYENSAEKYVQDVESVIQMFHDEVPRVFLNVLSVPLVSKTSELRGPYTCDVMTGFYCGCNFDRPSAEKLVYHKTKRFQKLLRTTIQSGKYDDKDDFTAVYQPFFENSTPPLLPDGRVDRSYFAPDCFHFSQKGQSAQATANWNSLFQPVGSKSRTYYPAEALECPSTDFPYLYTNLNSRPGFLQQLFNHSSSSRKWESN
ncbi:phospholipase B1, membrane-associated-like [Diadema antillarum]|uniref:phospholipase B1, membrane-associated-like n=1 Tax=Diadema antillarum TaxID=105358 RepID=UPI003A8550ED